MSTKNRAVAYAVTSGGDAPLIVYQGVVSNDLILEPALAVAALRVYEFPVALVRITDGSAAEARRLWNEEVTYDPFETT